MGFLEDIVKDLVSENVRHVKGGLNAGARRMSGQATSVKPGGLAEGGRAIYTDPDKKYKPLPKKFAGPPAMKKQLDGANVKKSRPSSRSKNTNYWNVSDTTDRAMKDQGVDRVSDVDYGLVDRPESPGWFDNVMKPYSFMTGVDFGMGERGEATTENQLPFILLSLLGAKGVGSGIGKATGRKGVQKMGPQTWHEAGVPAPPNRQLPRGPYRMGPATDPITGVPIRDGGKVIDPRRGRPSTYDMTEVQNFLNHGQGKPF